MLSIIKSMSLQGFEGLVINVEVDVSNGLPCWEIVGLPDTNIKESKERIKTAIKNIGIEIESRKYIINLSPANLRKTGGFFDVAIAIGVMKSIGVIKCDSFDFEKTLFIGELSLNGNLNKVNGVIAICIDALKKGFKRIILPSKNIVEASLIKGIEILGFENLYDILKYLNDGIIKDNKNQPNITVKKQNHNIDFFDVKGQRFAKRALEIAAAGGHNCLFVGPPGCGKTMMIKRLSTILPKLTFDEILEITKIYSVKGLLKDGLISERPFRNPHHSITEVGLLGGGKNPLPGEISLAHLGVLFLDEILEFDKKMLDSLRIPIEDKEVNIVRNGLSVRYPSSFMLIGSANPCPCGYFGSSQRECKCTEKQRKNYISKISGPLYDRFDLVVKISTIDYSEINDGSTERSKDIKCRVEKARKIQNLRYKKEGIYTNSELDEKRIEEYCIMSKESKNTLDRAYKKFKMSLRGYAKIKKIARTIADLENSEIIENKHLLEAIQYRGDLF